MSVKFERASHSDRRLVVTVCYYCDAAHCSGHAIQEATLVLDDQRAHPFLIVPPAPAHWTTEGRRHYCALHVVLTRAQVKPRHKLTLPLDEAHNQEVTAVHSE